jgi:tripartite motif-containing protein 71
MARIFKTSLGFLLLSFWLASTNAMTAGVAEAAEKSKVKQIKPEYVTVSGPRFANPHDLVLSLDKSLLFVADLGNNRVNILDPKTLKTIDIIGRDKLNAPHDVTLDNRGRLLVADSGNHRIVLYRIFGTKGKIVSVWDKGFLSPEGVTVDPDGSVYVTNVGHHNVMKFVNGKLVKQVGGEGKATSQFIRPHDVDIGPKGRVYVADSGNHRIQIFDKHLNFIRELKGPPFNFNEPKYLKIDLNGWLYVADEYNHQIKIFDSKFTPRGVIGDGKSSRKRGNLKGPEGIEVWNDNIWVSDTHNSRIQLFRRTDISTN